MKYVVRSIEWKNRIKWNDWFLVAFPPFYPSFSRLSCLLQTGTHIEFPGPGDQANSGPLSTKYPMPAGSPVSSGCPGISLWLLPPL